MSVNKSTANKIHISLHSNIWVSVNILEDIEKIETNKKCGPKSAGDETIMKQKQEL